MKNKINFALFRNNFIKLSETFIHDELRHHSRYNATIFARKYINRNLFQGHEVISTDNGFLGEKNPLSLIYGISGYYPLFFKEFEKRDFAFIHVHFGHNAYTAFPYVSKFNLPLIVTLHGSDVTKLIGSERYNPNWFHYTLRKDEMFEKTTLFLAASKELKELIIEAGCPENKVIVHRLGIDLQKFAKRTQVPEGIPKVLMVGRMVAKKGFAYGIRAFAKTLQSGLKAKLMIIGNGELHDSLKFLISSLNIEEHIEMVGAKPSDFVVQAMKQSSVVLTPSVVTSNMDRESGLIVAKEAAATGIPVIGHIHGGLPSIVDDGFTGFLVPERDVDGMAEKLIYLLKNPDMCFSFGEAARQKMENEYDIVKRNRVLEHIYDKVIENKVEDLINQN